MLVTEKDLDFSRARTKRAIFNDAFPEGAEMTVENARMATRAGLSLRCAAEQLMTPSQLERFNVQARRLLRVYFRATSGSRRALERLSFDLGNRVEWLAAHAAHEDSKRTHWATYLDGLAEAFVEALGAEAVSSPPTAKTP